MALTPASQLALRAAVSVATGGKYMISVDEMMRSIAARTPMLAAAAGRRDIALALRRLHFYRAPELGRGAYRFEDRSRLGRTYSVWKAAR